MADVRAELRNRFAEINRSLTEVNGRLDGISRDLAHLRERVARIEGHLALPAEADPQASTNWEIDGQRYNVHYKVCITGDLPLMEVTAKNLRARVGEVLACVERGESVVITYHGKPRARIVGLEQDGEATGSNCEPVGFGMWKNHEEMQDVNAYVRDLRKSRHAG